MLKNTGQIYTKRRLIIHVLRPVLRVTDGGGSVGWNMEDGKPTPLLILLHFPNGVF
jgi:hypothetical protein